MTASQDFSDGSFLQTIQPSVFSLKLFKNASKQEMAHFLNTPEGIRRDISTILMATGRFGRSFRATVGRAEG